MMVRELCIDIDENIFTLFTAEKMCHLIEYLYTIITIIMNYNNTKNDIISKCFVLEVFDKMLLWSHRTSNSQEYW